VMVMNGPFVAHRFSGTKKANFLILSVSRL
jgi:hypothetical protein